MKSDKLCKVMHQLGLKTTSLKIKISVGVESERSDSTRRL